MSSLSAPARGDLCPWGPLFDDPRRRLESLAASHRPRSPGQRRLSARNGPARAASSHHEWQPSVAESPGGRTFQSLPANNLSR
jgi:hypothetical protein